jgi:phosphoribosyl-ATP pyrophosphohydrolase
VAATSGTFPVSVTIDRNFKGIDSMIDLEVIHRIQQTLTDRKGAAPESSYVASLYAKGTDSICKKVAEEAAEVIMAAKDGDSLHLVREVTDLWFHSMILLTHFGLDVNDIVVEFRRREGISGIDEKNSRVQEGS